MKGHLAAQETKIGTALPASRFLQHAAVRSIADHTVQAEPAGAVTESRFGQDFSRVAAHSESDATRSELTPPCPVTPTRCPFGGACHTCPVQVQTKLAVNQPGDEYEQEADQVADQLMGAAGRQLQRRATSPASPDSVPPIVHEVLTSSGQPLDAATRAFMEPRFGHDFSRVRVHADAQAAESARAVDALAYTVRQDIVFGSSQYRQHNTAGLSLIAHELVHVVQQARSGPGIQTLSLADREHPAEREAEAGAEAVADSGRPTVQHRAPGAAAPPSDLVSYTGGQSGLLLVIQAGSLIFKGSAVSGHPGRGENEPSAGPIPTGKYVMHPGITRPTVATLQDGVCGAAGIPSGYQEITCTDCSPCSGAHYCNVPCPTTEDPAAKGFTPVDCWGPKRICIEGGQSVTTPTGKRAWRSGFYIHGGNPKDAVSSGCIKALDNGVFAEIRKLTGVRGAVPLCVGTACPENVQNLGAALTIMSTFETLFGL